MAKVPVTTGKYKVIGCLLRKRVFSSRQFYDRIITNKNALFYETARSSHLLINSVCFGDELIFVNIDK